MEEEIYNLQLSEKEVKDRTTKTQAEKQSLESQTSEGNNKILSPGSYERIKKAVIQIKTLVDRNKSQDQEPLPTLLEIERIVDKYIKMFEVAGMAD